MEDLLKQLHSTVNDIWKEFRISTETYGTIPEEKFWSAWYNKMNELDEKYIGSPYKKLQEHLWCGLTEAFVEGIKNGTR